MSILWLLHYLRGYVRFEAKGAFVERFLNLLARNRIPVWDGRKRGGVYCGCIAAGDYRRLRAHAKKTGVRLHAVEKHGAPFRRRQYRKRTGLLLGACIFFAFLLGMGQFIWRIEVNGNEDVSDTAVLAALERLGVTQGTLRASIDVRDIERRMLLELPELGWFALNVDGSVIYAELYERIPTPAVIDPKDPCNVVAKQSGQIVSLRVYEGQPMVREGDSVLAGDLIVSGITEDGRGQNLFRHALAEVVAEVRLGTELAVPLHQTDYREIGEVIRRGYLGVLRWELPVFLPFKIPLPYYVDRAETPLVLFGNELPLSWLSEQYHRMEEFPVTLTKEQAKQQALRELSLVERTMFADAQIKEKTVTGKLEDNEYRLRAEYVCVMDIAKEQEILVADH